MAENNSELTHRAESVARLRGALGMYPGGKAADPEEAFEQCLEEIRRLRRLVGELEAKVPRAPNIPVVKRGY